MGDVDRNISMSIILNSIEGEFYIGRREICCFFCFFFHLDNLIIFHSSIVVQGKRGTQIIYFHKRSDLIDVQKLP